ncbi:TetR family transcriptional regulator [Microbacterium sp. X-17]|uniref:TetR/AcrR family transcriptional regulator n=1 Tax=Microbacterium sp. X-17 TaxID=3144404 RepID=UPI0031F48704
MSSTKPATRDPQARRQAIVVAAADLIVEIGLNAVTHRKVAARAGVPLGATTHYFATLDDLLADALALLGASVEESLAELAAVLDDAVDRPRALARLFAGYMRDPVRLRAETAFYIASAENPRLSGLPARWYEGLVAELSNYSSPAAARAVAIYADGVMMHAAQNITPIEEDELVWAIERLLKEED